MHLLIYIIKYNILHILQFMTSHTTIKTLDEIMEYEIINDPTFISNVQTQLQHLLNVNIPQPKIANRNPRSGLKRDYNKIQKLTNNTNHTNHTNNNMSCETDKTDETNETNKTNELENETNIEYDYYLWSNDNTTFKKSMLFDCLDAFEMK